MPRTFDGADFDIHELEQPAGVKRLTRRERVSAHLKGDLKEALRGKEGEHGTGKKKSLIIAIASTIVLPGLGSAYIKRTFFGISILAFNLLFLMLGVSSFNILTSSFTAEPLPASPYPSFGAAIYQHSPSNFHVLFLWSAAFIAIAWLYLFYQLATHREEFHFIS